MTLILQEIRTKNPLIHHITNQVTMNFLANGILAAGGSPMMAHHREEVGEAVAHADALVLNIGTLDPEMVQSMLIAGKKAKELGIPVIFDPVGAGLSNLRKNAARRIVDEIHPDAICGNAAEISFLLSSTWEGRGVDGHLEKNVEELVFETAKSLRTTVALTGKTDVISDGSVVYTVNHGDELLTRVTGTGCFATSLIGLFMAKSVETSLTPAERATKAVTMLNLCAEKAINHSSGPGSFQVSLLDALYAIDDEALKNAEKVKKVDVQQWR
ncbi:hydroxyethylthiazole kinase [Fictibacillus sp. Mic-4]|uniref:hydroxyethylthiazole kinase n=1 Tax=Fictibacillus sp. Mic-4 TaxID=3132826 RepID=UPI003CF8F0A8